MQRKPHTKAGFYTPTEEAVPIDFTYLEGAVRLRPFTWTDARGWDEYLSRARAATFCHLSGWMKVVEATWHHLSQSLIAERDGKIVGVLPLYFTRSRLFGSSLVSTPNAVYGGVVADDAEARGSLLDGAKFLAHNLGVAHLELRNADDLLEDIADMHRQDLYVSFDREIFDDEDRLMKSLPRDIRRMIRLGPRHGLRAVTGREELLDEFYEVYATSVRNLGTPVFPKRLFAAFLRQFPDACDLLVIRDGAQTAGAVMSFYFRDTVMPYYGGAYPAYYSKGINNFMYWELMRRSAARGFTRFDFGRSKRGTGAYDFKRGWGMNERALPYGYFLVTARHMPNLNPLNPKFRLVVETWKRLPLPLTKLLGPRIVRNLP